MAGALSTDLRERVLAAYEEGKMTQEQVAEQFRVCPKTIRNWLRLRQETGGVEPREHAGGPEPALDQKGQTRLREAVEQKPDATLEELIDKVGVSMWPSAMVRWCKRLGLSRKKSPAGFGTGSARRAGAA